ncbi:hypothetical protein JCM10212_004799 [Sporobolomyces blumeae]
MLNQNDMVRFLSSDPPPPQHIVFSILHAYVFSKSRRGNLPSETLSKLLSVQRKLLLVRGGRPFEHASPVARAFEAMRIQLIAVNKQWMVKGVEAFGPLGAIGATGENPLAVEAWRKATDNKVKVFPSGQGDGAMGWGVPDGARGRGYGEELDAGRVIGPGFVDSADPRVSFDAVRDDLEAFEPLPPGYEPPTPDRSHVGTPSVGDGPRNEPAVEQDSTVVEALEGRINGSHPRPTSLTASEGGRTASDGTPSPPPRDSIEAGVSELARLRALKEENERKRIEKEKELEEANGKGEGNGNDDRSVERVPVNRSVEEREREQALADTASEAERRDP